MVALLEAAKILKIFLLLLLKECSEERCLDSLPAGSLCSSCVVFVTFKSLKRFLYLVGNDVEYVGGFFLSYFWQPDSASDFQTLSAVSGEKNLRKFMLENKLELYTFHGKVMNCGGGGSCGTCIVEILEGQELLSERTDVEYNYLKKNPESWRLACQTIVGDKSNSGKVVVQRLPQKKK
ncbi:unnamed protein product [Calypogeia fissa]